ncbi:MerR family transcriptional regulator [Deinococcus sp. HMF7620]|uniref:MerR family transcriptional regulator n=1 Tax=Deinococcus arboris TaxID=2682977 RepID=A0A7C9HZF5_9DEIO|nr:MerR family transcriptional regulator [Deinococcus arboris]MVN86995.1 MerR family transcriptional regulator [Deinococcus arboris]
MALTEAQFRTLVAFSRDNLAQLPPATRAGLETLCGGPEVFEALLDPRGVGIGRFAALMTLPVTTVRHLLREDLLHPLRVGSRFRFLLHNVIELRGVQEWQALGLTLDEVRAFLNGQRLVGLATQGEWMMSVYRQADQPTPEQVQQLKTTVLAQVQAAITRLEEKQVTLVQQLEQARALAVALAGQPVPELPS